MEMHLQPLATTCFVSGEPFVEGARVASYLVRAGAAMEIVRYDLLETHAATFVPEGQIACRWVHPYKPRKQGENSERALKLTTENLFVALADPTTEPTPENTRLVQFLALMLERKRILKPKGRSADGLRNRFEHAKSKQIFEVPAGELTPEFFVAVQEQLSVLVGGPKVKAEAGAPVAADASTPALDAPATSEIPATSDSVAASGTSGAEPAAVEPAAPIDESSNDAAPPEEDTEAAPERSSTHGGGGGTAAA